MLKFSSKVKKELKSGAWKCKIVLQIRKSAQRNRNMPDSIQP